MSGPILNYSISYNPYQTMHFSNKLLTFVKSNGKILAWMRPYDGIYFVKSYESLFSLQSNFYEFFEGQVTFFIQPVYAGQIQGMASPEIWSWINTNTSQGVLALQGQS